MEITSIRRVGGCAIIRGIIGLLFDDDVIPVRLRASCTQMLTEKCSKDNCPRYRTGTAGGSRISWDNPGATI